MKIVVDDKIPYIMPALHELADEVVAKPGREITADDVSDAYILIVRTRTKCNRDLLEGSSVALVVTATIGYDHLDTDYLDEAGIQWANCAGCNANSVAQYIGNSLLLLQRNRGLNISESTIGIVGVGHVGTAVLAKAQSLGFKNILLNDPPRRERGDQAPDGMEWNSLYTLASEANVITFHTPLTDHSPFATYHLADAAFFAHLQRKSVIMNAARGGVVDEEALLSAMSSGRVREAVIDTWENEPIINRNLLDQAFVATPHVAGYSADGKANATRMTLLTVCRFLGCPMTFKIEPPELPDSLGLSEDPIERALQLYNPLADTERLRRSPESFEKLRENYPLRREFA